MNLTEYLKSGRYLPQPLRDFHDQKDVFKCVADMEINRPITCDGWIGRHIYVIDYFLWFMARHGWTLQRSRQAGMEFDDLGNTINAARESDMKIFQEHLANRKTKGVEQGA